MTQMLNKEDFIRENDRIIADAHALADSQPLADRMSTYRKRDADLADVKDQHKAWLAATYLPELTVDGSDALYSVAEQMDDLSDGGLDEFYQDVANAFKVALMNLSK